MKRAVEYTKTQQSAIVTAGMLCLIFYLVFLFSELPMSDYLIAVESGAFLFAVKWAVGYVLFTKGEDIRKEAAQAKKAYHELYGAMLRQRKEEEEYFLMWIHQMKTPITASRLLLEEHESPPANGQPATIFRQLSIQLMYIEDYANMAMNYLKLTDQNTDMDIGAQALDDMIRPVIRKYASLFIQKHLSLDYERISEQIITDARWFSILFEQLLSNAVKYTKQGSISICYDKETGGLSVIDTGVGILEQDLPKIFDKGYSGFNGRINRKSSGLGLYMAKKIAQRLGMDIIVQSEYGKGSRFTILTGRQKA